MMSRWTDQQPVAVSRPLVSFVQDGVLFEVEQVHILPTDPTTWRVSVGNLFGSESFVLLTAADALHALGILVDALKDRKGPILMPTIPGAVREPREPESPARGIHLEV